MKKFASMLVMLVMVLTLSITLNSCGTSTVAEEVTALNKECPITIDAENKVAAISLEATNVVVTWETNDMPSAALMSAEMHETLKQFAKFDEHLVDLLKAEKKNIVIRFRCADNNIVDVPFDHSEL